MRAVKFIDHAEGVVEGIGVPFGGPIEGKDLYGESFVASTDFSLDWFPENRPLLYEHGLDDAIGASPVGAVKAIDEREEGLWIQAQLKKSHDYYAAISELIDDGALGFSSGSVPHLVKVGDGGVIRKWPIIEVSLTTSPANPYAQIRNFKSFTEARAERTRTYSELFEYSESAKVKDDGDLIWLARQRLELIK